jgi:collagenase-like PrtC family protease
LRVKVQTLDLAGHTTQLVPADELRDDELIGILSRSTVQTVTIVRHGSSTTYGPLEYSCLICGSYDHDDDNCSDCMACQEYSMMAPEDRPDPCPDCGGYAGENSG